MKRNTSFLVAFIATTATPALSQSVLLPKGIGLIQVGYRNYANEGESFDSSGNRVPVGQKFDTKFDGASMRSGKAGSDLQQLAKVLDEYGGENGSKLTDSLVLGTLSADVEARINAQFLGMGFGLTDRITIFAAIPYTSASVDTTLKLDGNNNAASLRQELGGAAFSELTDGLNRAAALSVTQIEQSLADKGYQPMDHWEYQGIGDIVIGGKTAWGANPFRGSRFDAVLTESLSLPTGYVDDPDVLTDVSLGKGYASLTHNIYDELCWRQGAFVGLGASYSNNFATQIAKRLPEQDEGFPDADRKMMVHMRPGDDTEVSGSVGWHANPFGGAMRLANARHYGDRYSGDTAGNYDRLAKDSDRSVWMQQFSLEFSTVALYQRKTFDVPFISKVVYERPFNGKNSSAAEFYEFNISTFFTSGLQRQDK